MGLLTDLLNWKVVAATGAVYAVFRVARHYYRLRSLLKIPGPQGVPLLGVSLILKYDSSEMMKQLQAWNDIYHPSVWVAWIGHVPLIFVATAEGAEPLLRSSQHTQKSTMYDPLVAWLGTGLLTSYGHKWKSRRNLLTPSFHFEILKDFANVFVEQAEVFASRFDAIAESGEAVDIFPLACACTLDVICETAMGRTVDAQHGSGKEYVEAVQSASLLLHIRQKSPWQWNDMIYKYLLPDGRRFHRALRILHGFTSKVIRERQEHNESQSLLDLNALTKEEGTSDDNDGLGLKRKRRLAFLDVLLSCKDEHGNRALSDEDIREEVDTFMFEGHDTTAAATTFALHLVGHHADVQARIHAELDDAMGDQSSPDWDTLNKLPYLSAVIKEALRLFPPVPIMGRVTSEECEIDGYTLPKGVDVVVSGYVLQRDARKWPEPDRFDPERFFSDTTKRHPYATVPFSAGPRNCIGQKFALLELKAILATVLKKFRVESMDDTASLRLIPEIILRPGQPILLKFHKRTGE